jgi:ribosomal protein L18
MMLKRMPPKRRRLGLTDYRKRLKLVKVRVAEARRQKNQ